MTYGLGVLIVEAPVFLADQRLLRWDAVLPVFRKQYLVNRENGVYKRA